MALNINGTTGISGVDGSASAASIAGTDANTGLSFASDTVNINTGGSTRATVDSSGRVLIGTTSASPAGAYSDNLVVSESSGDAGISVFGNNSNSNYASLYFGDAGAQSRGYLEMQLGANGNFTIGGNGTGPVRFVNNGAERVRIDSSGRLLAGRTNNISVGGDPSDHCFEQITDNGYALTVHSNKANQRGIGVYYPSGQTPEAAFVFQIASSFKTIIRSDGDLENANNSYGGISDVSLKENIIDANSQWDDIKNIKIRNYNFKASTGQPTHKQIGVIAQELETVCPNLVDVTKETGKKNVAYSVLYVKAVKALQEAMARIETLEAENTQMKTDLTALTTRVTALEAP